MPTGNSTSNRTSAASTPPGPSFQSSHTQMSFVSSGNGPGAACVSPPCVIRAFLLLTSAGDRDSMTLF